MLEENYSGLDRDTYKKVKSMNREKMEQFLADVYDLGKNSNREAVVDFGELRKRISEIKGIGEKRVEIIMNVVETYLMEERTTDTSEIQ